MLTITEHHNTSHTYYNYSMHSIVQEFIHEHVRTSLEYLVSVGAPLAVVPAHLVHLLVRVGPGFQGDRQCPAVMDPAVVLGTTEPGERWGGREGEGG